MQIKIRKYLTPWNVLIFSILLIAFIVRVYRIDQLLGFYYDQGRDAQVIWDLIHKGKLFLIGPTTGIAGIFRGPWYYWLITPAYFVGSGNPVYPSVFLSVLTVIAIIYIYKVAVLIGGKASGLISLIVSSISFYLVLASRWLSNPTPMFLVSILLIYSLVKILDGKKNYWLATAFLSGMAMQFGSATEIFYFPVIFLFWLINKDKRPNLKLFIASIFLFTISFLPQVLFDIKHDGILRNNIYEFVFTKDSFKSSFWEMVKIRFPFYFDVFMSKIFQNQSLQKMFAVLFVILLIIQRKVIFYNKYFKWVFLFFIAPIIGMLFFQGNYGNVYDYYFTGYYFIFVLLFSIVLGVYWKSKIGKIIALIFIVLFIKENLISVRNYIISGVDGPTTIALGNEIQAVDWVYNDAKDSKFNVDVYVPPVIPHSYNYLLTWKSNLNNVSEQVQKLYTIYEVDPDHPERLKAWLDRQNGIGKLIKEQRFGGIIVQERERIKYK